MINNVYKFISLLIFTILLSQCSTYTIKPDISKKGELTKKGKLNVEDPRLNVYWNKVSTKSFNYIQKI